MAKDHKESFHMRFRARNKECIDSSLSRAAGICGRRKGKGQFHSAQKTAGQRVIPQCTGCWKYRREGRSAEHCVRGQASVSGMGNDLEMSSHIRGGPLRGMGIKEMQMLLEMDET